MIINRCPKCTKYRSCGKHFNYSEYIRHQTSDSSIGCQDIFEEADREADQEKISRLLQDPILAPLLDDLCQWLSRILEIDISSKNFTVPLQTGDDLCRLALQISKKATQQGMECPKLIFRAGAKPGSFQARCNIEAFLNWARQLGVRETCLFETVDIIELKYLRNVLICLLEVSKLADVYGVEPPELVKLEKCTKIRWQDLIKLSMKRNSTGEVMSVADITSTVGDIQDEVNKSDAQGISLDKSSSVVRRWKTFTRQSLKSSGREIAADPDRILASSASPPVSPAPVYGAGSPIPESAPESRFSPPDSWIKMDEEVPEDKEEPREVIEVLDVRPTSPTDVPIGTPSPQPTTSDDLVTAPTEITITPPPSRKRTPESPGISPEPKIRAVELETPAVENPVVELETPAFEEITETAAEAPAEILLTLEDDGSAVEDEPMKVEEVVGDDSDVDVKGLIATVHSCPTTPQLELTSVSVTPQPHVSIGVDSDSDLEPEEVDLQIAVRSAWREEDEEEDVGSKVETEVSTERDADEEELVLDSGSVISTNKQTNELIFNSEGTAAVPVSGEPTHEDNPPSYDNLSYEDGGPSGSGEEDGDRLTRVTWCFALCFPAVYTTNKDGSPLSDEQEDDLHFKRSVNLLVGIILTIIGSALLLADALLGIDTGSGAEQMGVLSPTWFYVILGISLFCLIVGLSLLSLWVVQYFKMRNKKLNSYESPKAYGAIG